MNRKKEKILYLSLIGVFFCVIVTSIYYLLGGFEEVQLRKLPSTERIVVGQQFNNHYTNTHWIDFGNRCKTLIDEGKIDGVLTVITYRHDTLTEKEISKFVGITLNDAMVNIPGDFEYKKFETGERYNAQLTMHFLVQPRPDKVESLIKEMAQTNGEVLQDHFYELRYADGSLEVEGWVK